MFKKIINLIYTLKTRLLKMDCNQTLLENINAQKKFCFWFNHKIKVIKRHWI
ncbi:hypothetical protein THIOM_000418 [Candidatus Thiomargarita nelsonii]|uniref:Uncharacterized protein n=1 Tax=Candidatus Thiomargarita nelsonii TaxID=1003181 RepID=A0A176S7B7_9GAMM|nr:hypothetical protein THIOM_000418 [Candidatus Thiomargarita nelsonii]